MKSVYVSNVNKLSNNNHRSVHSVENEFKCENSFLAIQLRAVVSMLWVGGYLVAMRLSFNALDLKSIPGANAKLSNVIELREPVLETPYIVRCVRDIHVFVCFIYARYIHSRCGSK